MSDNTTINFESDDSKIDISSYSQNPVWNMVSISVQSLFNSNRYFAYNPYSLSSEDISFDITLVRRPLYFMMNNIFPPLIINLVVILLYTMPFGVQVGACMSHFIILAQYSIRVKNDMVPQVNKCVFVLSLL